MSKLKKALIVIFVIVFVIFAAFYIAYSKDKTDFGEIELRAAPKKDINVTRVMTFNLRCANDDEGSIINRSKIAEAIIEEYEPDSFGTQEETPQWKNLLTGKFEGRYKRAGEPRDRMGLFTEYSSVYYRCDKYDLADSGTIWLSETPEKKFSKSFDSKCSRIASWAVLENKETGEKYAHINTHLDHVLDSTRVSQAKVLLEKVKELSKKYKVVCTGDFNAFEKSEVYIEMLKTLDDTRASAENSDEGLTFHDYGKIKDKEKTAIDFIFTTKKTEVRMYKIIRDRVKDMYPSDHYPVFADICF